MSSEDGPVKEQANEDVGSLAQLTLFEKLNLSLLVMSYACVVSVTTLVVGTSAVVVLSVEGSRRSAPIALAVFMAGSAFVSLVTAPMFQRYGRKVGFLVGVVAAFIGSLVGAAGVWQVSPALVILASFPIGIANGIGMYLRFAAVEVVPAHAKAFAITLVLSGGCIAAFAGPESAQATRGVFGDDLTYLGVFILVGGFNALNAVLVAAVRFPQTQQIPNEQKGEEEGKISLRSLLMRRQFWVPALVATFAWTIMAMPMSVVRVAMGQLGFSSRESLLTIELHFLGMYSPGFVTGKLINRFGALTVSGLSVAFFVLAAIFSFVSSESSTIATWILALVTVGMGWNFGFSSATVLLTQAYADAPHMKSKVQAANDFVMFLLSGAMIFSTGYIYEDGGSELPGWRTVNAIVLGLIGAMALLVGWEFMMQRRDSKGRANELPYTVGKVDEESGE